MIPSDSVQVAADGTGKKIANVLLNGLYYQAVVACWSDGTAIDTTHAMPVSGTVTATATGVFWQTTQPVSIANMPLPAGASTEVSLLGIKTGTDKIPTSPSQEHARAGRQDMSDVFTTGELLPDQAGAGAVLTFTFTNPMHMVWVTSTGGVSRADPFGGTPTASLGVYCDAGVATPLPVLTTVLKVFAPVGTTLHVCGYRYS